MQTLDVKTAFLNAGLRGQDAPPESRRIVLLQPPALMVKLGLAEVGELWQVEAALYGLRESPRQWGDHRDGWRHSVHWDGSCPGISGWSRRPIRMTWLKRAIPRTFWWGWCSSMLTISCSWVTRILSVGCRKECGRNGKPRSLNGAVSTNHYAFVAWRLFELLAERTMLVSRAMWRSWFAGMASRRRCRPLRWRTQRTQKRRWAERLNRCREHKR